MPVELVADDPSEYLAEDEVIDYSHPSVRELARALRGENPADVDFAKAAFEQVRDSVTHSADADDPRVTLLASDALEQRTGLCYSKAHLLAAVLRSVGIPTGLCYQLLTDDEETFMVHGLVAVHLEGAWHRQDPRGNKPGVDAQFSLTEERLAWPVRPELGEQDYPFVYRQPSPVVVSALRGATSLQDLYLKGLPSRLLPLNGRCL